MSGFEDVIGSAFGDEITGDGALNRLDGGGGNDLLDGGGGGDQLFGGDGDDTCLNGTDVGASCPPATQSCVAGRTCVALDVHIDNSASLTVLGGAENNNIAVSFAGAAYVVSDTSAGVDGTVGCDGAGLCASSAPLSAMLVSSGGGNDVINASAVPFAASLNGGDGDDTIQGGPADDLIDAGLTGIDVLNGGEGNDGIHARLGRDQVNGEGGNDLVETSQPCEGTVLNGGAGEDNASFAPGGANFNINATLGATGVAENRGSCTPTVLDPSNESLEGSAGNDKLVGDAANNRLFGQGGDDELRGGGGNDTLNGTDGSDSLFGEAGKDDLRGDDGQRDAKFDCGPPKGPEIATVDKSDPKPVNCKSVKKKKKGKKKKK
jgi:Ca2+-binding RTX toxin-like protein